MGIPMFALSGNSDADQLDMGGSQEYNQIGMVKPITKWARLVMQTERVPEFVAGGFRKAWAGRPGPVHLSVPYGILFDKIDDANLAYPKPSEYRFGARVCGDPDLINQGLKLLAKANSPAIIAGGLVHWHNAADALLDFVDATGIPFFTKDSDVGAINGAHPLFFGKATPEFANAAKELRDADVVLTLGVTFDTTINYGRPPLFDAYATFINVDVNADEMGKNRSFEVGIVGDINGDDSIRAWT